MISVVGRLVVCSHPAHLGAFSNALKSRLLQQLAPGSGARTMLGGRAITNSNLQSKAFREAVPHIPALGLAIKVKPAPLQLASPP